MSEKIRLLGTVLVFISFMTFVFAAKDKTFQYDLDSGEEEGGETFQLHSEGKLADIIDLDAIPEIKRVACVGDRLLMMMTNSTPALSWRIEQVVLGGPEWGCNATRSKPQGTGIYVKIARLFYPLEGQVTIHHIPAGPFEMLEEANIHFHYDPGPERERIKGANKTHRSRRESSGLISNVLNNINWHANFSTSIPFLIGNDDSNSLVRANTSAMNTNTSELLNNSTVDWNQYTMSLNPKTIALHKGWGEPHLSVTRGDNAHWVKDDFVLLLEKIVGESKLAYTFELIIKSIEGRPQIVHYLSQYDVKSNLQADALIRFERELGLTSNASLFESPPTELLRVPVARVPGLPAVYLTVSYKSQSLVSLRSYSAGNTSLRTGFNSTGFVTVSQQFDPVNKKGSDVSSREWVITPQEQSLKCKYLTEAHYSVYQKLHFTSAVSWHYRDVDIELSPPVELSIRPEVHLSSSSHGSAHCLNSSVTVDSHIYTERAKFVADAFGLRLWDVPLQPAMTFDIHIGNWRLGQGCKARCHGPTQRESNLLNAAHEWTDFTRDGPEFETLRVYSGHTSQFMDTSVHASWCNKPGAPCYKCTEHTTSTPKERACASRLMSSRMAAALTQLSDYVSVEWPEKQLLIVEAFDEPTSNHPEGKHGRFSLYKHGRAASVALINRYQESDSSPSPLQLDYETLGRLSQLAVCSGLDSVQHIAAENRLELAVEADGFAPDSEDDAGKKTMFWNVMRTLDVGALSPLCQSAPRMSVGSQWPQGASGPEEVCGRVNRPLSRADRNHMKQIIQWNLTDSSLTFESEGNADQWCGKPTRPCRSCTLHSSGLEPWDWCSTRMMMPRLAIRLRKLQKLAEKKNIGLRVLQAYTEQTEGKDTSVTSLYHEGRGIKFTATPPGNEGTLASLAICAGFDYVYLTDKNYTEAFVKLQDGFQTVLVDYFEGPARVVASPIEDDSGEFTFPVELVDESVQPALLDASLSSNTRLSEHVRINHVVSLGKPFFRLDPYLVECFELTEEDFPGVVDILPDSVYRTRSVNFMSNLDIRHEEETWRFQAGVAMEIRPLGNSSKENMLALAKSVLRECPALVRLQIRGVGIGCHTDHLYVDLRPLDPGHEREYVTVWDAENTQYCRDVMDLQRDMILGGPVMQASGDITCRNNSVDTGLEFLSFQFGQKSLCNIEGQSEFCQASKSARAKAADDLQKLLTSAAGYGRLPRFEIIGLIRACLVDICGGCAGAGPVFDDKVRKCARLVHKYIETAASAFPELANVTTFFNTDTVESTVHALACRNGQVCVENTPIYSLFVPTVTARYYPDPKKSLQRTLFSSDINPTPLLELVAEEMAFRARGTVTVYIESEKDTYALRNVLKVLMAYSKNVTLVEFHVAPDIDADLVTSSIQRKVEAWSGVVCPRYSRFAITPFIVITMETERHRRSAEDSVPRNKVKSRIYDWEREWLDKMF